METKKDFRQYFFEGIVLGEYKLQLIYSFVILLIIQYV